MTLLKVNEPEWKQLHRIADGLAPEVSRELFAALDSLKGQIPTATLVDLIEDGRLAEVLAAVKLEMPDLTALQNAIGQIVSQSGTRAISQVEDLFPLRFDLVNPEAVSVIGSERWAQEYGRIGEKTNQLIQGVNEETQKAVNDIVQRGFLEGTAPRVQALQIESMIGLTNRDGLAVSKYLKGLTDSGVSERRARDLAGTYHDRLLRRRAQMIARTETMRAANLGQQLAWENATDLGLLLPGEVQKVWIVTDDDRTCARCLGLEDAQVDLDAGFTELPKEDRPVVDTPPSKDLKPKPRKSDFPPPVQTKPMGGSNVPINQQHQEKRMGMHGRREAFVETAERYGTTEQGLLNRYQKGLDQSKVMSNAESHTFGERILQQGRFKSQFETNTSGGTLSFTERGGLEKEMFGYQQTLSADQRPIYGWVGDPGRNEGLSDMYGKTRVVWKDSIRPDVSVTYGDSLGTNYGASPIGKIHPSSVDWESGLQYVKDLEEAITISDNPTLLANLKEADDLLAFGVPAESKSYVEAQIHGGQAILENIEEVFIPRPSRRDDYWGTPIGKAAIERMDELGIKWSWRDL